LFEINDFFCEFLSAMLFPPVVHCLFEIFVVVNQYPCLAPAPDGSDAPFGDLNGR